MLATLSLLDSLAARLQAPLPILASVTGLMLGGGAIFVDLGSAGWMLDTYDLWFISELALTPDSVVVLFLPPLLLEVTLGVDVRKLRADTVVVAVMAILAVLAATAFVGGTLALVAGLPLVACLLLGATISTTDPAAVVSIFRRIGAPRRLLIVLEGESLLNDAAAIALFVLLIDILQTGSEPGVAGAASSFAWLFVMGALAGTAVGAVASRLMGWMLGSFLAQSSLILATAYASFLAAELVFGASGVVSVVSAGLTLTVSGVSRVSNEDWQATRTVWAQIGYWSNGLIILIAAALAPGLLVKLEPLDVLLVLVAVAAAFTSRAFILFILLPLLDLAGLSSPIVGRQKVLIWWGGIRGAVTILLALSLATSSALPDGLGARLAAIGAGFVLFTLLVNGSTLALVTRLLGLDRLSASDAALRAELILRTMQEGVDHVNELAAEHGLSAEIFEPVREGYEQRLATFRAAHGFDRPGFGDRLRTGLVILANQERRIVRQHYDAGVIGRNAMRSMQRAAESLGDAALVDGRSGYALEANRHLAHSKMFHVAAPLQRYMHIDGLMSRLLARRFHMVFEWQLVLRDLHKFTVWRMEGLVGSDACDRLVELIEQREEDVHRALHYLELQYPNYADGLRRAFVSRAALRWEAARYDKFLTEAIISVDLHRSLKADLDRRVAATYRPPPLDARFDRAGLVDTLPLLRGLGERERRQIIKATRVASAVPGDIVVARGARDVAACFVASGALEMTDGESSETLGTGTYFGETCLLRPTRRRTTDVVALGFCQLLVLHRDEFRKLCGTSPGLRHRIEDVTKAAC